MHLSTLSKSFPQFSLRAIKKVSFLFLVGLLIAGCGGDSGDSGSGGNSNTPDTSEEEVLRIGNGSGGNFVEGVISASQTSLNAGESITLQVNVVDQDGNPPTGSATVSFNSVCVASGLALFDVPDTSVNGLLQFSYTAQGCSGDDIITATLEENGDTATVTLAVQAPEVLNVSFTESTFNQLSIAGIGGTESAELTFLVTGPQGVPIIGDTVNFSINTNVGGAAILAGRESGITDNDGLVQTILKSGTVAGPVNVLAEHIASGIQGLSDDITISTGIPVQSRFSLSTSVFNPPNAFNTDGIAVTISILAGDQFGNNPTDGTQVSFVASESGNIQSSCALENGACSVTWRSSSPRPTDGRLEIIAYTVGAEDFVDQNGNGIFDGSDGVISDVGEPFADENELNGYELGEFFFDTNDNGVRDSGNGLWDGPCLVEVNPAALCAGSSSTSIFKTLTLVLSTNSAAVAALGTFPAIGVGIDLTQGASRSFGGLVLSDSNGNPLPLGTTVEFSITGTGVTQDSSSQNISNTTAASVDQFGVSITADAVDVADPLPTGVMLNVNVQVPGVSTQRFNWPVTLLR